MLTEEGIKTACDITQSLNCQMKAMLAVSVDENGDTRLLCDGMQDDVVLMLDKVSYWRDNLRKTSYKERRNN